MEDPAFIGYTGENNSVDLPLYQAIDKRFLFIRVVLCIADDQVHAVFSRALFTVLDPVGNGLMNDFRYCKAYHMPAF